MCMCLSELLPGVVAPRSGWLSVMCMGLSELLLGVVAPRSGIQYTCTIQCGTRGVTQRLIHVHVLVDRMLKGGCPSGAASYREW